MTPRCDVRMKSTRYCTSGHASDWSCSTHPPPAPPWYGVNVWCGLDADAVRARELLARQLEGLYHLPFGKFERLTPAGTPAQVAEALAPYRAAGAAYITLIPAAASPEAGVEHVAAVRAMLE